MAREQVFGAIRAFTSATVAEAEAATKAIIRIVDNALPDDGTCIRCGAAPRNASGLCATCVDEDAVRAGECAGEYVRDDVTTNSIESVFAVLKRRLIGIYHHASPKHLPRYVDEFSFRLNEGNVKHHTMTRLDSFVKGTAGKRLTYKGLIQ